MPATPPLLVPTTTEFRPVSVADENALHCLFGELKNAILNGQRLTISILSVAAQAQRPRLRCVDCHASGHRSKRYGGCADHGSHHQGRIQPPGSDRSGPKPPTPPTSNETTTADSLVMPTPSVRAAAVSREERRPISQLKTRKCREDVVPHPRACGRRLYRKPVSKEKKEEWRREFPYLYYKGGWLEDCIDRDLKDPKRLKELHKATMAAEGAEEIEYDARAYIGEKYLDLMEDVEEASLRKQTRWRNKQRKWRRRRRLAEAPPI